MSKIYKIKRKQRKDYIFKFKSVENILNYTSPISISDSQKFKNTIASNMNMRINNIVHKLKFIFIYLKGLVYNFE